MSVYNPNEEKKRTHIEHNSFMDIRTNDRGYWFADREIIKRAPNTGIISVPVLNEDTGELEYKDIDINTLKERHDV